MKTKNILSILCISFLVFVSQFSFSQLILNNLTVTNNNQTIHYYDAQGIISPNGGFANISPGSADVDFTSDNYIHLKPGFHAYPYNTGIFHAYFSHDLDFTIIEPQGSVPKYEKLECGLMMPQDIADKITRFLEDAKRQHGPNYANNPFDPANSYYGNPNLKPGTTDYDNAFANGAGDYINPYDPEHISVEAYFCSPSGINKHTIYGFYYHQMGWLTHGLEHVGWYEDQTKYNWRIRFAPDELGTWVCKIKVKVGSTYTPYEHFFTFKCDPSNNYGYIKVGPNNRNFMYQDAYSNGTTNYFFPIGDHYDTSPLTKDCFANGQLAGFNCGYENFFPGQVDCHTRTNPLPVDQIAQINCENFMDLRIPTDFYNIYEIYADEISKNDGNFCRFFLNSHGLNFEREQLGIYETRKVEMFEMDKLLELFHDKGIYIDLVLAEPSDFWINLEYFNDINDPHPNYGGLTFHQNNTWRWNPYRDNSGNIPSGDCVTYFDAYVFDPLISNNFNPDYNDPPNVNELYKGIKNVFSPLCFFTNDQAKKYFKNRLRYLVARWGYSTNIAYYEIYNEIDQTFAVFDADKPCEPGKKGINMYYPYSPEACGDDVIPGAPAYIRSAVTDWVNEMAKYLKTIDPNHLTSITSISMDIDYDLSQPKAKFKPGFNNFDNNGFWSSPYIDVGNVHVYETREYRKSILTNLAKLFNEDVGKPIVYTETSTFNYAEYPGCIDWDFHNYLWSSTVCGSAASATNFTWQPGWNYEEHYPALRAFINSVNFDNNSHSERFRADNNSYVGAYDIILTYNANGNASYAYGWLQNRSYFNRNYSGQCLNYVNYVPYEYCNIPLNYSMCDMIVVNGNPINFTTCNMPPSPPSSWQPTLDKGTVCDWPPCPGYTKDITTLGCPNNTANNDFPCSEYPFLDFTTVPLPNCNISIPGFNSGATFQIDWYLTDKGTYGGISQSQGGLVADISGTINNITVPYTGGANPNDWAFIINQTSHRLAKNSNQEFQFEVKPNPSKGIFTVDLLKKYSSQDEPIKISVLNPIGETLFNKIVTNTRFVEINLSKFSRGIYFIQVNDNGNISSSKVEIM